MKRIEIKNIPLDLENIAVRLLSTDRCDLIAWHLPDIKEGIQALTNLNYKIGGIDMAFIWLDNKHIYQPMWGDFAELEGRNEVYLKLFDKIDTSSTVTIDLIMELIKMFDLILTHDLNDSVQFDEVRNQVTKELKDLDLQKMYFCLYVDN